METYKEECIRIVLPRRLSAGKLYGMERRVVNFVSALTARGNSKDGSI